MTKKIVSLLLVVILGMTPYTVKATGIESNESPISNETIEDNDESYDIYSSEPEGYNNLDFTYHYETNLYGSNELVAFTYANEYYSYLYDERGIIVGLCDAEGKQIVTYTYDEEELISGVYSLSNGSWVENNAPDFIGNLNKMLWLGAFYDETTQCYYTHGRYFNPATDRYMDGINNDSIFVNVNPYLEDGIMPIDTEYIHEYASLWAEDLLATSNYGIPISYRSNWYSGLSDVELLARAIFGEGGTTYTNEQDAVVAVMLNRLRSTSGVFASQNTLRSVITAPSQFTAIVGGSDSTQFARRDMSSQDTNLPNTVLRWEHATYLACLAYTTTAISDWDELVGNPIGQRYYFYSYTAAQNSYNDNQAIFRNKGTTLHYCSNGTSESGVPIKDVYVLGYGTVTSFTSLFHNYDPTDYSRNIYYNFQ